MNYLVCGLGNIGAEYDQTRHNIGFMVVDEFVKKLDGNFTLGRLAYTSEVKWKGRKIFVLKPTTYMNLSGKAFQYWMREHQVPLENTMVITDDLALPFGALRMRAKGSHGGHNGLANIQELLQSDQFPRLRFGIGNNFAKGQQSNFVLGKFGTEEQKDLPLLIDKCAKGLETWMSAGIAMAMNVVNTK
ncbi:MAG: aminoacyl-tRNA hydrolase [Cytophagaceae bacterium]|nr:aminoacyl-tRNA hydrolase [Cytophagaceae bacterium]